MIRPQRTIRRTIRRVSGAPQLRCTTASRPVTAPRRRATVLVLVITVLSLLFVVGAAFMATMTFEAELIRNQQLSDRTKPGVQSVAQDMAELLQDIAVPGAGKVLSNSLLDSKSTYVELPGVHNLRAPLEPTNFGGSYEFPLVTDLGALTDPKFDGSFKRAGTFLQQGTDSAGNPISQPINAAALPGTQVNLGRMKEGPDIDGDGRPDPTPALDTLLDADGDGIVDSIQFELSKVVQGQQNSVLENMANVVNPASVPNGKVFIGVRIIDHSAMVNLNASHPLMIETVLGDNRKLDPPYSPFVEEPTLRNRFMIPPKELPPTRIQGNPMSSDPDSGEGDFSEAMFPPGQSLRDHRYWAYEPDEAGADPDKSLWGQRLDPNEFSDDPATDEYDRRHLTTTVSADDQLMRPTTVNFPRSVPPPGGGPPVLTVEKVDLLSRMQKANVRACASGIYGTLLPFELPNYPFDLRNKFRGAIDPKNPPVLTDYCLALNNPREFSLNPLKGKLKLSLADLDKLDDSVPEQLQKKIRLLQDYFAMLAFNARNTKTTGVNSTSSVNWGVWVVDPSDPLKQFWLPNFDQIARTAASLAANFIDYYDSDDIPTKVEVRSYDYRDLTTFGQPLPTGENVFGIERQPYISEVVVVVDETGGTQNQIIDDAGDKFFFGVELFNPFDDQAFRLVTGEYEIRTLSSIAPATSAFDNAVIKQSRPGGNAFLGIEIGDPGMASIPIPGGSNTVQFTVPSFQIQPDSTIQLIRWVAGVPVVIDSFKLPSNVKWDASTYAFERGANSLSPWTVTVPEVFPSVGKFGNSPGGDSTGISPVHAIPANTGCAADPAICNEPAFPTTGSMLLLMRYANSRKKAFTSFLDDEKDVTGFFPIDNGHMPILDEFMNNHVPPDTDPTTLDVATGLPVSTLDAPGEKMHLPWGQLLFDYFTAIPRDSQGPYKDNDGPGVFDLDAKPKVDMNGLRVHGRINLNSAPWTVLQSLPLIRLDAIPNAYVRTKISDALALPRLGNPLEPTIIGKELAKAIVAYREVDELFDGPNSTGDYRATGGRNWGDTKPTSRRGSGFMSVGELANVRLKGARPTFRTDLGFDQPGDSFLDAAALLIALDDWATVRSNVFTIYGVVRGEKDQTIIDRNPKIQDRMQQRDADGRALRFQETLDRTPALIGLGEPIQIGEPITGRYNDPR